MAIDLTQAICELIRITSTDLPEAVEQRLRKGQELEAPGSAARGAMDTILENVEMTRKNSTPICQDTGTPIFFVKHPVEINPNDLAGQIRQAVELATKQSFLRPNAVDSLTGRNTGNNLGDDYFPSMHFNQVERWRM
jgi:fumarate hydratase class I